MLQCFKLLYICTQHICKIAPNYFKSQFVSVHQPEVLGEKFTKKSGKEADAIVYFFLSCKYGRKNVPRCVIA